MVQTVMTTPITQAGHQREETQVVTSFLSVASSC